MSIVTPGYAQKKYKHEDYFWMHRSIQLLLSQQVPLESVKYELSEAEKNLWYDQVVKYFPSTMPDSMRPDTVSIILYEAKRTGLDPLLVLSVITVESNFRKYAVSYAGACGLMQVMPFWIDVIGEDSLNIFDIHTNIRYGCLILRHYLDMENGNLTRALARYNGSINYKDYTPYPKLIFDAISNWQERLKPYMASLDSSPKN